MSLRRIENEESGGGVTVREKKREEGDFWK